MMIIKAFIKYLFNRKEANNVMINLFAMQVTLGWLKVEDIPEPYKTQVVELKDVSHTKNRLQTILWQGGD